MLLRRAHPARRVKAGAGRKRRGEEGASDRVAAWMKVRQAVAELSINGRKLHFRQTCSRFVERSGIPSVNLTMPPQTGR